MSDPQRPTKLARGRSWQAIAADDARHHALPETYGREILRVEVGSTLHGTGLEGHEDHDEMGVFTEQPASTIGLGQHEHYIWRSAGGNNKSTPADTDLVVYSLRKWAKLALNGNPSVLLVLFAPSNKVIVNSPLGEGLRENADWFASKRSGKAFLGYMEQQRQRMVGQRGRAGRVRVMPDGGVDWKYAMHILRLGHQGVEFLSTGRLSLPVPGWMGDHLRAVRRGDITFDQVIAESEHLEEEVKTLLTVSSLPDVPNIAAVEAWVIDAHLTVWRADGLA